MARCGSCNTFVSYQGDEEPTIESEEFHADSGDVQIEVRLMKCCANCGNELKEGYLTLEDTIDPDIIDAHQGDGHDLEMSVDQPSATEDVQRTDRKGKPIKNYRYMKTLYGAALTYTIACSCSDDVLYEGELSDNMPASAMDELY